MKRLVAIVLGLAAGAVIGFVGFGYAAPGAPSKPPAASDPTVPAAPRDTGVGERLLLVVGGQYATRAQAEAAAAAMSLGELQGYYVVPVTAYLGLREALGAGEAGWALVSAFRTREGAEQFASLASSVGIPARLAGPFVSMGGPFAGLGQETDPAGNGPLARALTAAEQPQS